MFSNEDEDFQELYDMFVRHAKTKTTWTSAGTSARRVTMPVTAVSGGGQEAKVNQKQMCKVMNMLMDGLSDV